MRLGGGARNADVFTALRAGNHAITHGRCKGVGVAGLTLGGGIGFSQRLHGLTCDQLVETEIVIASGELLVCNATENADLFWACRGGGGGNFGVNVSLTFRTFPVGDYTVFKLTWSDGIDDLLPAALELLPSLPDRLGCKLQVEAGSKTALNLLGQLAGTQAELAELLAPLYRVSQPSEAAISVLPYWLSQEILVEEGAPEYSHERSRYIYRPLPAEAIAAILDYLRRWPGTHDGAEWKIFLAGGAVASVAPEATAFVHRKALMLSVIDLAWTPEDHAAVVADNEAWLDAFHAAMRPFTSDESFQNFVDGAETDYLRAYYGTNLERLVEIKRRYDPEQSVPLSAEHSAVALAGKHLVAVELRSVAARKSLSAGCRCQDSGRDRPSSGRCCAPPRRSRLRRSSAQRARSALPRNRAWRSDRILVTWKLPLALDARLCRRRRGKRQQRRDARAL